MAYGIFRAARRCTSTSTLLFDSIIIQQLLQNSIEIFYENLILTSWNIKDFTAKNLFLNLEVRNHYSMLENESSYIRAKNRQVFTHLALDKVW